MRSSNRLVRLLAVIAALGALTLAAGAAQAAPLSIDGSVQVWPSADSGTYDVEEAAVISPDGVYGYFATNGCPAHIAKVRLSDLTRVADVTTSATVGDGECSIALAAAISPDGATGYFGSNGASPKLLVVRLSDMTITDRIAILVPAEGDEGGINKMALSPDGSKAYLVLNLGWMVTLDLGTGTITDALDLTPQLGSWPRIVRSLDGVYAYVSSFAGLPGAAHVVKVRLSDLTVVHDLALDPAPVDMSTSTWAISPDGAYLYYSVDEHNSWESRVPTLVKVRTSDDTQVASLTMPDGDVQNTSSVVSPDGADIYVGSQHGHLYRVDTATMTIVDDLDLNVSAHCDAVVIPDSTGCAARSAIIAPDGSTLYVTNWYNGLVKVGITAADPDPDPTPVVAPDPATISIVKVAQDGGRLTVRLRLSDPGRVVLRVARIVKGDALAACTVATDFAKSGVRIATCRLNLKTRQAIAARRVQLRVSVSLRPDGADRVSATRTVTVARDRSAT